MSLDLGRLEQVKRLPGGIVQARCPACAEGGHDRSGEHLRIFADGRFGCCIAPKDRPHRQRIFALAGDKEAGAFTVRVSDDPVPAVPHSVRDALKVFPGTPGTIAIEEAKAVPTVPSFGQLTFGTGGTDFLLPRAYDEEESIHNLHGSSSHIYKLEDLDTCVLAVPGQLRMPHFRADGTLVIPYDSPERYHWWRKGGQSVQATRSELEAMKPNKGRE